MADVWNGDLPTMNLTGLSVLSLWCCWRSHGCDKYTFTKYFVGQFHFISISWTAPEMVNVFQRRADPTTVNVSSPLYCTCGWLILVFAQIDLYSFCYWSALISCFHITPPPPHLITATVNFSGWFKSFNHHHHHHHNHHQGLDHLVRSVSQVTTALFYVSSVFQLFSFLVVCNSMISKGFDFVAFFASVEAS